MRPAPLVSIAPRGSVKAALLVALLAAAGCTAPGAPRTAEAAAPAAAQPARDPCVGVEALPDARTCGGAPLCAPRERVAIACELRDAMEDRYVFLPVKARMLASPGHPAFDARARLDACVAAERKLPREDEPLRFYDRIRSCTSAFADGHLIVRVPGKLPQVALGIGLRLAQGKVLVANRNPRLLAALAATPGAPDLARLLAPGAEVVSIDGRSARDAVEELARLVPASSTGARLERAVDALTRRDFAFPEQRTARLVVEVEGARATVELPWWTSPGAADHPLAGGWARRTGIPTTDLVDFGDDPKRGWDRGAVAVEGVVRGDSILPAADAARLTTWRGDRGLLAARLGPVDDAGGRRYCYAQLLTFHTETLSDGGKARPFTAVLGDFVKACDRDGRDLVLDLRQNEGGYISHSSDLAAMLAPRGAATPGGALLLRATARNEQVYRERVPAGLEGGPDVPERRILAAIDAARRGRREFTPAFLDPPLHAPDRSAGFGGKVVALVSPACMSSCDRLAGLLRSGGRALLVGGPTEGAGGSQQETKDVSARWVDRSGKLAVSIPNAAMGVQRGAAAARRPPTPEEFFSSLAIENRPVEPHVAYATSREDLVHGNAGWLAQVRAALGAGTVLATDHATPAPKAAAPAPADAAPSGPERPAPPQRS